jgi:hypothetical protein
VGRALVGAVLAAALAPAPAGAAGPGADPVQTLAGRSPLCAAALGGAQRRACRQSGAVEHAYPISHYGLDVHIQTGPTHPENTLAAAIHWLVTLVWTALLYLLKGVLLLMQWAFSLDLLGQAMTPARQALQRLHNDTLGAPWLSAALVLLGAWALLRGVVQRRATQTATGLALAVAMMAGALAVVNRPAETVGALSHGANEAALGLLAGASTGSVRRPTRTLAEANRQVFDAIVLRPWCALQFADVQWCLRASPATGGRVPADRWLRYEPDSRQRQAEYAVLAGDSLPGKHTFLGIDPLAADTSGDVARQTEGVRKDSLRVKLQTKTLTPVRIGLLVVVALGMAGCVAVLAWLTFKIVVQAVMTLVLLLGAPVMLLAPAFGDRGRDVFAGWAKRLFAAALAKAIYALLLGIVLTLGSVIGELDSTLPWFVAWLIGAVYWWGIFLHRTQLMGFVSLGHQGRDVGALLKLHFASQALAPAAGAAATAAPRAALGAAAALRGGAGRARRAREVRADQHADTIHGAARERLHGQARHRLEDRYQQAHRRLAAHDDAREKLGGLRKRISDVDRDLHRAQSSKRPEDRERAKQLEARRAQLIGQRRGLEARLMPRVQEGVARRFIEAADRNQVEQGTRFTDNQLDSQLAELRSDVAEAPDADDPRHLWRARRFAGGISDSDLGKLNADQRADLHRSVADDLARDRALLGALPDDSRPVASRQERRSARDALAREDLQRHQRIVRETRKANAAERRLEERDRERARRSLHRKR